MADSAWGRFMFNTQRVGSQRLAIQKELQTAEEGESTGQRQQDTALGLTANLIVVPGLLSFGFNHLELDRVALNREESRHLGVIVHQIVHQDLIHACLPNC